MKIESWMILPDIHFPYHSHESLSLVSQLMESERTCSGIIQLGDCFELESVSKWQRGRQAYHWFKDEVKEAKRYFYEFRHRHRFLPFHIIFGNHEHRLARYIAAMAPSLEDMGPTVQDIFSFKDALIAHTPYTINQLVRFKDTDLYFRHEPVGSGRMSAKSTAELGGVNLIYGHTHTSQKYTHKNLLGEIKIARSLGWLGDSSKACFDYRGSRDTWSLNCAFLYYNRETKGYYIHEFDLNHREIFFNGRILKP